MQLLLSVFDISIIIFFSVITPLAVDNDSVSLIQNLHN